VSEETVRVRGILLRWASIIGLVGLLWVSQIFAVLFWLLMLLLREVKKGLIWIGAPTQQGAQAYWAHYWKYWLVFYIILLIITVLMWIFYWRHKRPHLMVGGVRDGRVLWIKGVRQGLIYDCWDVYNYFRGPDSPFVRGSQTRDSLPSMDRDPGMLQDPLKIGLGRETTRRIIYFSRPWGLRVQRLFLLPETRMVMTHTRVSLPVGYIVNAEDPEHPGSRVLVWGHMHKYKEHDPGLPQQALEGQLDIAKANVQGSVAANPSIIQNEYMEGSLGKV